MTPAYLNLLASPSSTSADHVDHTSIVFSSNDHYQAASSCSHNLTTRNFFDPATTQDQSEICRQDIQQPQYQQDLVDNLATSHGGSFDIIENESSDNGLRFSIWKKEEKFEAQESSNYNYDIKWMSPKMRWMHKMKNSPTLSSTTNITLIKHEDQKQQPVLSSHMEIENTSNTSSNSMISSNPIRTCSDCNTTKTPLWRSGPQGPKSLCNACGIRQRKARRAMAAAANDTAFEKETTPPLVIKTKKYNKLKTKIKQQKDKTSGRCVNINVAKSKKRSGCNLMIHGHDEEAQKKVCLEDFLLNLTNNLAYHQVFPQDEKDAAILLMAMSLHHAHRH